MISRRCVNFNSSVDLSNLVEREGGGRRRVRGRGLEREGRGRGGEKDEERVRDREGRWGEGEKKMERG